MNMLFFKKNIRKILDCCLSNKVFLILALRLHSACYKLAGIIAIQLNKGVHPKHNIMQYKEWFLSNIDKDDVVLDVGCNTGLMSESISHKAKFVYGIEIDLNHVRTARRLRSRENIDYICADATIYDYSKCKPVNVVALSNVLEHIENRVDFLSRLVKKIRWKDASNRRMLIRVPMIDRDWIVIYKKNIGLEYRLDNTHFIEYTFEKFQEEVERGGVEILSYHIKFGEIYAVCKC